MGMIILIAFVSTCVLFFARIERVLKEIRNTITAINVVQVMDSSSVPDDIKKSYGEIVNNVFGTEDK